LKRHEEYDVAVEKAHGAASEIHGLEVEEQNGQHQGDLGLPSSDCQWRPCVLGSLLFPGITGEEIDKSR